MTELLPAKASFRPDEAIGIEVRGVAAAGTVRVWHLHEVVVEQVYAGGKITLPALPLARPALATATIFTFLATWDEFAWALTIITTPENQTLPIAIALLQGPKGTQWGLVFAASIIAILPVIVVFLVFQRHFVQGLTAGAVKG